MTPGIIYIAGVNDTKLQISRRIFVKIQNSPNRILRGHGGKLSREKKTKVDNLVPDSL
jgi:hypothetical protein